MTCNNCGAHGSRVVYRDTAPKVYDRGIDEIAEVRAREAYKEGELSKAQFHEVVEAARADEEKIAYYCMDCHRLNGEVFTGERNAELPKTA